MRVRTCSAGVYLGTPQPGLRINLAPAALRALDEQLGCRSFDVLVADALYLQQGFVQEVEASRREWVISLKENQPGLLAEAQRLTYGPPETTPATGPEELQLWHAPEVYWPVADRSILVVKTVRIQIRHRVRVRSEDSGKNKDEGSSPRRKHQLLCHKPSPGFDPSPLYLPTGAQPLADRHRKCSRSSPPRCISSGPRCIAPLRWPY
jgi:hypothetical protein